MKMLSDKTLSIHEKQSDWVIPIVILNLILSPSLIMLSLHPSCFTIFIMIIL